MKLRMNEKQHELWAGVILMAVLVVLASSIYFKKKLLTPVSAFDLYATFNKVDGITKGSTVRLNGLPVGKVSEMSLDPYYRVQMKLSFPKKVALPEDTAAIIETDGLVGNKYIELIPGGEEEILSSGDHLAYTQDVLLLDELLSRFLEFMRIKKGEVASKEGI